MKLCDLCHRVAVVKLKRPNIAGVRYFCAIHEDRSTDSDARAVRAED